MHLKYFFLFHCVKFKIVLHLAIAITTESWKDKIYWKTVATVKTIVLYWERILIYGFDFFKATFSHIFRKLHLLKKKF